MACQIILTVFRVLWGSHSSVAISKSVKVRSVLVEKYLDLWVQNGKGAVRCGKLK